MVLLEPFYFILFLGARYWFSHSLDVVLSNIFSPAVILVRSINNELLDWTDYNASTIYPLFLSQTGNSELLKDAVLSNGGKCLPLFSGSTVDVWQFGICL
jgi:hypothetical protein